MEKSKRQWLSIGSYSHGTLRSEDLAETFADILRDFGPRKHAKLLRDLDTIAEANEDSAKYQEFHGWEGEILSDAQDAIQAYCPPYTYFGAHEGDGSDFGCWPINIDECDTDGPRRVSDFSQVTESGEYFIVNDHGNVTAGRKSANGQWIEYWSCV